jgi:hypothetical protein
VRRLLAGVAVVAAVAGAGCKSTGGSSDSSTKSDPIFGRNIPKQDLPVPGKDGYGADVRDPLLRNTQASKDGDRFEKEPYRPGSSTTPASLAAKGRDDQAGVPSIDDRPTGTPTSRSPVPFKPAADPGVPLDQSLAELRRIGAKWSDARRASNGEMVFDCDVPLGPNGEGPFRHYEGAGATEAAAANDAVKQIKSESNR